MIQVVFLRYSDCQCHDDLGPPEQKLKFSVEALRNSSQKEVSKACEQVYRASFAIPAVGQMVWVNELEPTSYSSQRVDDAPFHELCILEM
jgi:hypothetical protein